MADSGNLPAVARPREPAVLVSFDEMRQMAKAFAESGLFGVKTEAQALSVLMIGQAEGMHPALAVQEFDIIEGKPARKSERIQARFQMSGGSIKWLCMTDEKVEATFSHPQGSEVTIDWTIDRARKIQYSTKDGYKSLANKLNWRNYTRAMLKARVISEGCRACFPGYAIVTMSTEEALDYGTVESVAVEDDESAVDQIPEGFIRGAAKDKIVNGFIERLKAARPGNGETIDDIVAEFRKLKGRISNNALYAMEEVAEHEAERFLDGAPPAALNKAVSPFEGLKASGLDCASQEALDLWTKQLTPAVLKACSETEVEELRNIYANMKAEISANVERARQAEAFPGDRVDG